MLQAQKGNRLKRWSGEGLKFASIREVDIRDRRASEQESTEPSAVHKPRHRLDSRCVTSVNRLKASRILEYKTGDDKALEQALAGNSKINRFAFMNYDRETRI